MILLSIPFCTINTVLNFSYNSQSPVRHTSLPVMVYSFCHSILNNTFPILDLDLARGALRQGIPEQVSRVLFKWVTLSQYTPTPVYTEPVQEKLKETKTLTTMDHNECR